MSVKAFVAEGTAVLASGLAPCSWVRANSAQIVKSAHLFAVLVLFAAAAFGASSPKVIHWQGNLRDAGGVPITGTNVNFTFKLFTAPSGPTELWTESYTNQTVTNGLYEFDLGSVTPMADGIFVNEPLYLEIQVSTGVDPLVALTPRVRFLSAPFAVHSLWAEKIKGDATVTIAAGSAVSTFTTSGHLELPGGLSLGASGTPAAGQILFGAGANQSLSVGQIVDLTDGGITSLHTHSGVVPGTHSASHALGGTDPLGAYFVANTDTLQSGATFYVTSGSAAGTLTAWGGLVGPGSLITGLNASNITAGTLANARLDPAVTLQGNSFNAANTLVRLDGAGNLPSLNASALTDLNAGNLASGIVPNARLDVASVTMVGPTIDIFSETIGALSTTRVTGTLPGNQLGSGSALYIWNTDTLQSGATFYVSSATVDGTLTLMNGRFIPQGADPSAQLGLLYYNSATGRLRLYNSNGWVDLSTGATVGIHGGTHGLGGSDTLSSLDVAVSSLTMSAGSIKAADGQTGVRVSSSLFISDGNVGIGTLSAAPYRLRVQGDVYGSGAFDAGVIRASSFTDTENTAYFLDPAGISMLSGLSVPAGQGGINVSTSVLIGAGRSVAFNGASPMANAVVFGAGANEFLTAIEVSSLTYGGPTTLHTHTGILPGPHANSHAMGQSDSLDAYFITNTNTLQPGSTFYVSSGTVGGNLTAGNFYGAGANITGINAANITTGILSPLRLDVTSVTMVGPT
ncbi:MAG: hypothetical protein HYT79_06515, partial [Elusimicrobia bacterium]|nr:hypothetical protein [Elusimicrobiota bacterium]